LLGVFFFFAVAVAIVGSLVFDPGAGGVGVFLGVIAAVTALAMAVLAAVSAVRFRKRNNRA
jgi:hypothetical protein